MTWPGAARAVLAAPGMDLYVLAYDHGWQLLADWLDAPDRDLRVSRLLNEPLLPANLTPPPGT